MTSGGSAFQLISPQLKSPAITIFGCFFKSVESRIDYSLWVLSFQEHF